MSKNIGFKKGKSVLNFGILALSNLNDIDFKHLSTLSCYGSFFNKP